MEEFKEVMDNIRYEIEHTQEELVNTIGSGEQAFSFEKAMEVSALYNRISNLTNIVNVLATMRVSESSERTLYRKLNDHICSNNTLDVSALDKLCSFEKLDEVKYNFIEEQIRSIM